MPHSLRLEGAKLTPKEMPSSWPVRELLIPSLRSVPSPPIPGPKA
jgi:hypothetical protein